MPYVIPVGWVWCRLKDIAYVAAGSTPSKESFVENGVPYIKMYNLRNQKIDFEFHPQYITEEVHNNKLARSRTQPGDLLMNIVGPPLGKLAIIPESLPEANFNQAAVLIRPLKYKPAITKYLFYYLSELSEINSISTKGSAGQVNISLTQSQQMRIALPPLAELERITQKIESLFSKIDVVKTSTGNIYDLISKIKSSVLEKALSGKLVSQDKTDEPAITLLKSINPNYDSTDNRHYENKPFLIPDSWLWVIGKDLFLPMKNCKPSGDYFKYIDIDSIDNQDCVIKCPKVLPVTAAPSRATRYTQVGDILFSMVRPYLKNIAIVTEGNCIASTGFYVCSPNEALFSKYCYYLMISPYVINGLTQFMKGDNSPSINNAHISEWLYPLPPLNEQKRIVQAIDEIFNYLDSIVAEL